MCHLEERNRLLKTFRNPFREKGKPFWRIDRSKPYEIAPDLLKEYEGNMESFRAMIEYNAKENYGSAAAYGISDDMAKDPDAKPATNAAGLRYNPMMD